MKRVITTALLVAACAATAGVTTARASGAFTFGRLIATVNTSAGLAASLPATVDTVTVTEISPLLTQDNLIPTDPCRLIPTEPCRTIALVNAVQRNAASVMSLRGALSTIGAGGPIDTCDGDLCFSSVADRFTTMTGVPVSHIVAGTYSTGTLTLFYLGPSNSCIEIPGDPC